MSEQHANFKFPDALITKTINKECFVASPGGVCFVVAASTDITSATMTNEGQTNKHKSSLEHIIYLYVSWQGSSSHGFSLFAVVEMFVFDRDLNSILRRYFAVENALQEQQGCIESFAQGMP